MVKNCTCAQCNYSLRTNIYSFLIQMDHVPLWRVLHGVWWETVHINHRTVHLLMLHELFTSS